MIERFPYYYRKGKNKTLQPLSNASRTHIPIWLEKVRQNENFREFDCFLFGSLMDKETARDMDIFYSGDYMPELIVDLLDYSIKCAMEMGIKMDVFYIPDYTYLTLPPSFISTEPTKIYTSYDFEIEVEKGKVKMFREFGMTPQDGLFLHLHHQHHQKSIDRGTTKRFQKLI